MLWMEHSHAEVNDTHEAQRRCSYARLVLIEAFNELIPLTQLSNPGPASVAWRSKVLSPLALRLLFGIQDAYLPAIASGVINPKYDDPDASDDENLTREVTIIEATEFYLSRDMCHSAWLQLFRHSIIYSREMRWFLLVCMYNKKTPGTFHNLRLFNTTIATQQAFMQALKAEGGGDGPATGAGGPGGGAGGPGGGDSGPGGGERGPGNGGDGPGGEDGGTGDEDDAATNSDLGSVDLDGMSMSISSEHDGLELYGEPELAVILSDGLYWHSWYDQDSTVLIMVCLVCAPL